MSLTYGFYNSQSGDRVYSTQQISEFLEGLIEDGVYLNVTDGVENHHGLLVRADPDAVSGTLSVVVSKGRAWFNGTWTYIDTAYKVTLSGANQLLNRIDAIVLTVNKNRASRSNYIEVISGTGTSGTPEKPEVVDEANIYRHVLAWVTVNAAATAITDAEIEDNIGHGINYVSGILEPGISAASMITQWESEFNQWFDHMKGQLTTDAAGNLQTEIDTINNTTIPGVRNDYDGKFAIRDPNFADEYNSSEMTYPGKLAMFSGVLKQYNGISWDPVSVDDLYNELKPKIYSYSSAGVTKTYGKFIGDIILEHFNELKPSSFIVLYNSDISPDPLVLRYVETSTDSYKYMRFSANYWLNPASFEQSPSSVIQSPILMREWDIIYKYSEIRPEVLIDCQLKEIRYFASVSSSPSTAGLTDYTDISIPSDQNMVLNLYI